MKNAGIFPLIIVIATVSALGQKTQSSPSVQSSSITRLLKIDPASCPVDLQVEHSGTFAQSRAEYGVQGDVVPSIPEQRVLLTMTNHLAHDVVSAKITAHGYSKKGRVVPLLGASPAPDLATSVDLAFLLKGNSHTSKELSLMHFTSVVLIEIDSVTYADGSAWRAQSPGACSAAPSMFMPVTASR